MNEKRETKTKVEKKNTSWHEITHWSRKVFFVDLLLHFISLLLNETTANEPVVSDFLSSAFAKNLISANIFPFMSAFCLF